MSKKVKCHRDISVADPGFPIGGVDLVGRGGAWTPEVVTFQKFVCQNERIWTLRGACAGHAPSRSANAFCQKQAVFLIVHIFFSKTFQFHTVVFLHIPHTDGHALVSNVLTVQKLIMVVSDNKVNS